MVALVREFAEHRVHLVDARRVEVRGRLVEYEHGGGERECAGDRKTLPAAAREHVGVVGSAIPQADELQGPLGAGEHLGRGDEEVLGTECHFVEKGSGDDLSVGILEDHRHVRAELCDAALSRVGSRDAHGAVELGRDRVRHESVEGERERRLAAARRSEHQHDLAGTDVERDAVRRGPLCALVPDAHGIELEQRWLMHVRTRCGAVRRGSDGPPIGITRARPLSSAHTPSLPLHADRTG